MAILVIVVAIIIVFKRIQTSPKCRDRVVKVKRAVFFNPIIRYVILNSLKLDIMAFVAIYFATDTVE